MNTHPYISKLKKHLTNFLTNSIQISLWVLMFNALITPVRGDGVIIRSDCCEIPEMISGEGIFGFDNTTATLDGPGHALCAQVGFGEDQIDRDVWAIWTATCTSTVFVQTCGLTTVDTRIAIYDSTLCPGADGGLLTCNDDRCDLQSLATFEALQGHAYLIRIGTFPDEIGGTGSVSITCGINACPGVGDCMTANGSIGCDDEPCCENVCKMDPFCCESEWDENCGLEAGGLCTGSFETCVKGAGDCTIARTLICRGGLRDTLPCADDSDCPEGGCAPQPPGCGDVECCNAVCMNDPFCCIDTWDEFCVAAEPATCFLSCGAGRGDCVTARAIGSEQAGCDTVDCCSEVCPRDTYCCQVEWDDTCVDKALIYCTGSQTSCPQGEIVWIDPPHGVVDARFPLDPSTGTSLGIYTIIVQGPQGIQAECFSLCETDGQGLTIDSLEAVDSCGSYKIRLSRPITAGAVTTVTYTNELGIETTAEFTSHPANSNADGFSNATDINSILEALLGISFPLFGQYSLDIDHSDGLHPSDILTAIDLLNGADPFIPWINTLKPTSENICP